MKYKKPPITEAIVELHFDEVEPDQGIGGRFYESWKDRCEKREQIHVQQIQVSFGTATTQRHPGPPVPTERLWLKDPWSVVQVGPGLLTVHMVTREEPYPGFDEFFPKIVEAVEAYTRLRTPRGIAQASMRYVNRLDIPKVGEARSNWISVAIWLPDSFDDRLRSVSLQAVVSVPSANAELHYVIRPGNATESVQQLWLDLNVLTKPGEAPSLDDLHRWLRSAHDDGIIDAFEGSITDEARAAFGIQEEAHAGGS